METQKTPTSQSNLEEKKVATDIILQDLKLYCKATVIKIL